jgi:hypothetical protein
MRFRALQVTSILAACQTRKYSAFSLLMMNNSLEVRLQFAIFSQ